MISEMDRPVNSLLQQGKGREIYEYPSGRVSVKEFQPAEEKLSPDTAIFFMPGWSMGEETPTVDRVCQSLSDEFGAYAYALTARSREVNSDSISNEIEDMVLWMQRSGIKRGILVGQSDGALRAARSLALLDEMNERLNDSEKINIEGLVLIDSMGLYDQTDLAKNFVMDSLWDTPKNVLHTLIGKKIPSNGEKENRDNLIEPREMQSLLRILLAGKDIGLGIGKEMMRSKLNLKKFIHRLKYQIMNMEKASKAFERIKTRVILISGMDDRISSPSHISPQHLPDRMLLKLVDNSDREIDLKKRIFKSAKEVKAFYPKRLSNHGLLLLRTEQMAKVIAYLMRENLT